MTMFPIQSIQPNVFPTHNLISLLVSVHHQIYSWIINGTKVILVNMDWYHSVSVSALSTTCPAGFLQFSALQPQAGIHLWPDLLHLQEPILHFVLQPQAIISVQACGIDDSLVQTIVKPAASAFQPLQAEGGSMFI